MTIGLVVTGGMLVVVSVALILTTRRLEVMTRLYQQAADETIQLSLLGHGQRVEIVRLQLENEKLRHKAQQ